MWKFAKDDVIERDRFCVVCGSAKNLTVHHIKPLKQYPQLAFEISNLVLLCKNCHENQHKKGELRKEARTKVKIWMKKNVN